MKGCRSILFFFILTIFIPSLFSQETDIPKDDKDLIDVPPFTPYSQGGNENVSRKDKTDVHFETGTSFTSVSGKSFMSYYAAPSITYNFSPKFDLTAGLIVNRTSYPFYKLTPENGITVDYTPETDVILFSNGIYRYNEKLSVSGGVYKKINDVPPKENAITPLSREFQGMSLGINYSISENFHVGFEFNYSDGVGLYNSYPYGSIPGFRYYPYAGF